MQKRSKKLKRYGAGSKLLIAVGLVAFTTRGTINSAKRKKKQLKPENKEDSMLRKASIKK